jgi:spore maturation protein CgeB
MRWLVTHPGPNFSVADVHAGWVEALRAAGEQVQVYSLDTRLSFYDATLLDTGVKDDEGHTEVRKALDRDEAITLAANGVLSACYQWWPDVVLGISAFFLSPHLIEMMRKRGHKVVLVQTEEPYETSKSLERGAYASINLLNDPVNIREYLRLGIPAYYMPHAYRPHMHCPGPPDPRLLCDLAFVGTGFETRIKFFEAMNLEGIDTVLAGNWMRLNDEVHQGSPLLPMLAHEIERCLDNEQTVDAYRSAKAGINLYRGEETDQHVGEGWAMGPREIEMAATGLFFLREPRAEGDEVLHMLPTFDSPEDASEKLHWFIGHNEERAELALKARSAIAGRTFDANVKALLGYLERL